MTKRKKPYNIHLIIIGLGGKTMRGRQRPKVRTSKGKMWGKLPQYQEYKCTIIYNESSEGLADSLGRNGS